VYIVATISTCNRKIITRARAHLGSVGLANVVDSDPVVPGVLPAPGREITLVLHDASVLLLNRQAFLGGFYSRRGSQLLG
jgi:hypothetical protein